MWIRIHNTGANHLNIKSSKPCVGGPEDHSGDERTAGETAEQVPAAGRGQPLRSGILSKQR